MRANIYKNDPDSMTMPTIDYLHYDDQVDHLVIYKESEKISSNIDTGLVIISLNDKKDVIGLEFMGAQKNFNIPEFILKNLKGCKVTIEYNPNLKFVSINLILQYRREETPFLYSSGNVYIGKNPLHETFAVTA